MNIYHERLSKNTPENRRYLKLTAKGIMSTIMVLFIFKLFAAWVNVPAQAGDTCTAPFLSISQPLNDLGGNEYIRPTTGPTGHIGGLYPGGLNVRPPAHEAAGVAIADQIEPLDSNGNPDPINGEIVMISIGFSNTEQEFDAFLSLINNDPDINDQLVIVNGSRGSLVSHRWADPSEEAWQYLAEKLAIAGVTPQQVQVAWVKLTQFGDGAFPQKAEDLQADLEQVARNLKGFYPNTQLAYYSSRTRAYVYWDGLSPESTAFETAFSVRWMLEKQINGDPALNYDPDAGSVLAPYLSWGPYLWIDGLNPRSDGLTWPQEDLDPDCTHPSASGEEKVANQLLNFFRNDSTTASWFLNGDVGPTETPEPGVTPTASTDPTNTPRPGTTPTPTPIPTGPAPTATPPGNTHMHLTFLPVLLYSITE